MNTGESSRKNKGMMFRTIFLMALFGVLAFVPLVMKLYEVQILKHDTYEEMAVEQQTKNTVITPARGTIYDRNMKALAISASVNNVYVDPSKVTKEATRVMISQGLGAILDIDPQAINDKILKYQKNRYISIKLRVEQEEANAVREFIVENSLSLYIGLEPNTKRYYPYGNFASNVIGFVNIDGQGLEGLELKYNEQLTGTPGRIVTASENSGAAKPVEYEKYYDASNGLNMVLTMDETIQHFLEKHLGNAVVENEVTKRAFGIVMDVKTGGILAMATSPSYDLNKRNEVTDPISLAQMAGLEGEELETAKNTALLAQYRNKAVVDTYEPGSTFKIVTAAIALEEKVVTMADRFNCSGQIMVAGWDKPMHCHRRIGHGAESFLEGVQNSCNPVFITVGLRIGRQKFWEYMEAFGFFEKTGIDMSGESSSIIAPWDVYNYSDVPLATYSYGQTFNVTPTQMITAASAVANDGKLMWPHIVSEFVDNDGNVVQSVQPRVVRQVISEETAAEVCYALEKVVSIGTGKNAGVTGYKIAGKTGTSQKTYLSPEQRVGHYVVSFLGFAPADDPQIALLVALDEPMKGPVNLRSGGNMAAPLAGRIFGDILPYMGINPQYAADDVAGMEVMTPTLKGLTIAEAEAVLKANGITNYTFEGEGETVLDQLHMPGIQIPLNTKMILYTETQKPQTTVTVPSVMNMTPEKANKALVDAGLSMRVSGTTDTSTTVKAGRQEAAAGEEVPLGTIINVTFIDTSVSD